MNFETAIFLGILVGPIIYISIMFVRGSAVGFSHYHFGNRQIPPSDFIDSTIMYSFQVAVISLFATWGFLNGFWALVVPIFWGAGYLIVVALILTGSIDRLIFGETFGTIHGFIAQKKKFRYVAMIAALITLFGIAGPAMFEASFVAELLSAQLSGEGVRQNNYKNLFYIFISISAVYMVYSGFSGVVGTDKAQLTIGFVGFCFVFASLIVVLSNTNSDASFYIGLICSLFSVAIFATNFIADRALRVRDWNAFLTTAFGVVAFVGATSCVYFGDLQGSVSFGSFVAAGFGEPFSVLAIVSLAIANGLYQLVDVGHWQRLLAVHAGTEDKKKARRTLALSTLTVGIYSPLIWALAVIFGLMLRHLFPDGDAWTIVSVLVSYFESSGYLGAIGALVFVAALTAIMFSTLDSLISAVSFTVHDDILLNISEKFRSVFWARAITLLVVVGMANYYLFMKRATGDQFDAILYLSWSFQIALVPAVLSTFLLPSTGFVITGSLIAGCVGAAWPIVRGSPETVFEQSPLLALLASSLMFLILDLGRRTMGRRLSRSSN